MQSTTRTPAKMRRHADDTRRQQRQPRPAARRQTTRAAQIRAAMQEG